MKRVVSSLVIAASLVVSRPSFAGGPAAAPEWDSEKTPCSTGLRPQPTGPYAALLFCEDALGDYLAVVRLKPLGQPSDGPWSLSDRYWHDPLWGADVTGYRWSKDGSSLYVTTSPAYGSGGAYRLDLAARRAYQLLPAGPGYLINQVKLP
jgi:hypothetical protein